MITAPITGLVRSEPAVSASLPKPKATAEAAARPVSANAQPAPDTGETVVISSNLEAGNNSAPNPPSGQSETQTTEEALSERIRELNQQMQNRATQVQFTIDDDTENVVVRVLNKETGEVIREIPPEEILNLKKAIEDMRGLVFSGTS